MLEFKNKDSPNIEYRTSDIGHQFPHLLIFKFYICAFLFCMDKNKVVGRWLLIGVAMLMIQVILGGITRLTGSGLSMTEWKPIIGMLPPLNDAEWNIAFEKYKQIGQYKFLNQDFLLSNFKFIFFWEWFHRNWAQFIGFVFLIPFIYFLYKKMISKKLMIQLIALFFLGIMQGVIGKIMVASGLNDNDLYVSHIKLAIHFVSALILIVCTYWFALGLLIKPEDQIPEMNIKNMSFGVLVLLSIQLIYGAFMAGLKAANAAPTWPSINGDIVPPGLLQHSFFHHPINIHFIHRMLAYLILTCICIWYWKAVHIKTSALFSKYKIVPVLLVLLQIILGILSVLTSEHLTRNGFGLFETFALLHQIVAMCLVMSFVWAIYVVNKKSDMELDS